MVRKTMLVLAVAILVASVGLTTAAIAQEEKADTKVEAVVLGNTVCPVSGAVIEEPGLNTVEYEGVIYNLCSSDCKAKFLADPATYVAKAKAQVAEEKAKTAEAPAAEAPATEAAPTAETVVE